MKKRGSALVSILIVCTVVLVFGTAVSATVINTAKLNKKYSDDIDLELAAKSGLNIFKEELLTAIESVSDSSNLPNSVAEIDSGINSFDNITILKEVQKETIENSGTITAYKYTVISTAKYKSIENSISKTESQVITVNLRDNGSTGGDNGNDEDKGDIGDIIITPVNFINVSAKVEVANTNQKDEDLIKYISSGDEFRLKGQLVNKKNEESLKNLNLSLNTSIIEDNIKSNTNVNIDIDKNIPVDKNSIEKTESIDRIKNKTNTTFNNETVKFEGSIDFQNDLVINLNNSTVFINGRLNGYSNSNITFNLENSILIISEDIYTTDKLNINLTNSTLYSKKISAGNALNIIMNNGKIINNSEYIESRSDKMHIEMSNNSSIYSKDRLYGNKDVFIKMNESTIYTEKEIYSPNTTKFELEDSTIYVKEQIFGQNGIDIKMNNSSILVNNIDSNNGEILFNIENESILYCKNQLKGNKLVTLNVNKSNIFVEESNLESTSGEINLNIENKGNIFVGKKIYSPKKNSINLNNGNVIIGFKLQSLYDEALSNSEIQINSLNGACIMYGTITAGSGIKAELENSTIICMGKLNIHSGFSKLTNIDKSYVLISGNVDKSYISNLELESKTNSITPDSSNVINTLNKYLNKAS